MEIEIHIEVCQSCDKHKWCTHHDEKKYSALFVAFKSGILLLIDEIIKAIEAAIPNSVVFMNTQTPKPSIGAFEVTHKGIIIYSKKQSGLFPEPGATTERIKQFLDDLKNKKDVTKYAKTTERKYIPPKKQRERPTFQSYLKQKEEEERKQHEKAQQQQQQQPEGDPENGGETAEKEDQGTPRLVQQAQQPEAVQQPQAENNTPTGQPQAEKPNEQEEKQVPPQEEPQEKKEEPVEEAEQKQEKPNEEAE